MIPRSPSRRTSLSIKALCAVAILSCTAASAAASSDPMEPFLASSAPVAVAVSAAPAGEVLAQMVLQQHAEAPVYQGRSVFHPIPDSVDDPFRDDWTGQAGDCWYAKPGVPAHWGKCL